MVGMRGEPRLGAAGPRQRMRLAALLSFCLLVLLPLHTFTTSPPLWCGNRRTIPRMEGASFMLKSKEWEGGVGVREPTGRDLVCKILKPQQAIFFRADSRALSGCQLKGIESALLP